MSVPDVVEQLGEALDLVGPLYRRAVRRLEAGEADGGLPLGIRAVLDLLGRVDARTVPQVASTLGVSRQFVQRSVDEARARGYVAFASNPAHRRSSLVTLTEAGRAAVEGERARERDVLQPVADEVSAAEAAACLHVLRCLLAAVSEGSGGPQR